MNKTAIILAAGSGSRAGGSVPKQLQTCMEYPFSSIQSIDSYLDARTHKSYL